MQKGMIVESDFSERERRRARAELMMPTDGALAGVLAAILLAALCVGLSHEVSASAWSKRNDVNMHKWIAAELKAGARSSAPQ